MHAALVHTVHYTIVEGLIQVAKCFCHCALLFLPTVKLASRYSSFVCILPHLTFVVKYISVFHVVPYIYVDLTASISLSKHLLDVRYLFIVLHLYSVKLVPVLRRVLVQPYLA